MTAAKRCWLPLKLSGVFAMRVCVRACVRCVQNWAHDYDKATTFVWDVFFAALMMAAEASSSRVRDLAFANVITTLFSRTVTGMVPNYLADGSLCTFDRSEPMLGSWTVRILNEVYNSRPPSPPPPPLPHTFDDGIDSPFDDDERGQPASNTSWVVDLVVPVLTDWNCLLYTSPSPRDRG